MQVMEDSQVWVPAEEPITNPAFLLNSKIWEICQELPIHWIHPSPMRGTGSPGSLHPYPLSFSQHFENGGMRDFFVKLYTDCKNMF